MKMTIGQRILLGIGLVEILALGLGLFMLYTLSRLREIESTIKARDLTVLDAFNGLNRKQGDLMALRQKAIRLYMLRQAKLPGLKDEGPELAGQTREEWRKYHGQVGEILKQLQMDTRQFAQNPISKPRQFQWEKIAQNAQETADARKALRQSAEVVFELLAQGKLEAIAGPVQRMDENRLRFDQQVEEGIELTKKQIELGNELSAETYRGAWVSSLLGLGLMLAVGMVAGLAVWRSVTQPLGQFMLFVENVGRGDLTSQSPTTNVSDLERLGESLNRMVVGLRDLAGQIIAATQNLNAASQEILASVQETAAGTRQQAASVQEITATVEEVGQSGTQISERARQVATAAENTASTTTVGLKSVEVASRSMESIREQVETFAEHIVALSEKTQAVGEIIGAVTDIAERSNLLALNAAIEAAGAGDHGSRFAVVAGEMKNLADQAKESTVQVQSILVAIQKGINSSVMLTEEAVKRAEAGREQAKTTESTIRQMADTTQESVHAFQQIIAATNQQQIGLEQVTQGMKDIRQAATQTATATSQLEGAVTNVNALSQQLQKAAGRYKL